MDYVWKSGALVELGLNGFVQKQTSFNDVDICQISVVDTSPSSQVENRSALSNSNVLPNGIASAATKNLEHCLTAASTNDAGTDGKITLTAVS